MIGVGTWVSRCGVMKTFDDDHPEAMDYRPEEKMLELGAQQADGRTWITLEYDGKVVAIDLDKLIEVGIAVKIEKEDLDG